MAPMILFDDGTSRYRLGPGMGHEEQMLSEHEVRRVLARWLAKEPWRCQLRRFAAAEIQVEARTDDGLVDRLCVLLGSRGMRLRQVQRMGLTALAEVGETEQTEPLVVARARDESHWIRVIVVDVEDRPVAGVAYRIELTDGRVQEGRTDADGALYYDEMPGGECTLSLIERDESTWAVTTR
jgi:hypothetical protein